MAAAKSTTIKPPKHTSRPRTRALTTAESSFAKSPFGKELIEFAEFFRQERYNELETIVSEAGRPIDGDKPHKVAKKIKIKVPASKVMGAGQTSEQALMRALGWYWEPLLHDLAFFEEMRDAIPLISGEVQKMVDIAMNGFQLNTGDPKTENDLKKALLRNPDVDLHEVFRSAMVDMYSLGTCYKIPIWGKDDQGRKVPKTFKPVRANAMRILRDENLVTEGYVQLLHRPSEFIFGTPATPTIWEKDQVLLGRMHTFGWYCYGSPLLSSLPFVLRIKLQMERELAEMLHQHLPRIDITFTPEEQMNQEQVDAAVADVKSDVAKMRPTDNFIHTPDVVIDYKGPAGKGLDFQGPQKHIESQHFYVFGLSPAVMGLDSTANPMDSQQRWTVCAITANALRERIEAMFAPVLDAIADDWGIDQGITISWSQLDPTMAQQNSEAEEYSVNNAVLKRDNGFIDQDTAARQGTSYHKGQQVTKAAKPGAIPPPKDPNKQPSPGSPAGKTPAKKPAAGGKVRKMGPKTDGTKVPDKDKRPKGKRHGQAFNDIIESALLELQA